jgi:hypothetical protein
MENITIALSNGTELTGLELNGNNYISPEKLTEDTFADGLSPVVINGEEHEQMALVQCVQHADGRTWFILRDVTAEEVANAKLRSDIDFIALMSDIEL